jgi:DNA-binding transcriptional ArsR family regulator
LAAPEERLTPRQHARRTAGQACREATLLSFWQYGIAEAATAFSALAQETRPDVMRLLIAEGPNGLPAGEIALRLGGLSAPRLSFHLAALERAGRTRATRHGRHIPRADTRFNRHRLTTH